MDAAREQWTAGTAPSQLATKDWTTHEWLHFLRGIPYDVGADKLAELDAEFKLTQTGNSEILHEWLLHVIGSRYEPGYEQLESFLTRPRARKFLQPLYRAMADQEDLLPMAKDIYGKARSGYHSVSVGTIDQILDWQE